MIRNNTVRTRITPFLLLAIASFILMPGIRAAQEAVGNEYDFFKPLPINETHPERRKDRELEVPLFKDAPTIDGKLTEDCWKKAAVFEDFLGAIESPTAGGALSPFKYVPVDRTNAYLGYDEKNLYIGIAAMVRAELIAERTERDDKSMWQDDCIEIWLDTNLDRNTYYYLITNSIGARTDAKFNVIPGERDYDFNSNWTSKSSVDSKLWMLEIVIPWKDIGIKPGRTTLIGINIARENRQKPMFCEFTSIAGGGFHAPQCFPKIRLKSSKKLRQGDAPMGA